jgi:flagellar protein FlaG
MINEISQNVAGVTPAQSRESSESASQAAQSAVKALEESTIVKQAKPETAKLVQDLAAEKKVLESVVDDLNQFAQQSANRQLEFSVDQDSGKTIIKVIDADTGDTIRDIPSEEVRNMQKHLKEMSDSMFESDTSSGLSLLFKGEA